MNNRTLVSRIEIGLNALNKDTRTAKRYILEVATSKAIFYMAQKFRDRSLFRESNLFTTIDCFEMTKIDKYNCDIVEFKSCNTVMKSVNKLPKLLYSRYGSSIKDVTNIDYTKEFKETTISKYRRDKQREEYNSDLFYYIKDGDLYLPDVDVKRISLLVYTPNQYEAIKVASCGRKECLNPWDFEFIISDKLSEVIIQETIKEVGFKLQIPTDENPNMDSNLKSKTTN